MKTRRPSFGRTRSFRFLCLLLCLYLTFSCTRNPSSNSKPSGNAQVEDFVFHSASLGRNMHYRVLLPADYENAGGLPVLYLLHGLDGDYTDWDTITRLEKYAKNLPIIIAMPDADDSWYTNSATVPADKFEDYIAKDFVSEVDSRFRTIRDRRGRAIAGLSMGGYGSLKFSLKSQLFAFAGSLSGALNAAQNLDELRPDFRKQL